MNAALPARPPAPLACAWLALALTAFAGAPLHAQQADEFQDQVTVQENEGSGNGGRIAVNLAAGSQNQQLSSAVLAQGRLAVTGEAVRQSARLAAAGSRSAAVIVEDDAFSRNSGLTTINLTAGSQNQSANLAIMAVGITGAISDQLLEQSRAPIEPSGGTESDPAASNHAVAVSEGAFGEGNGLIQINLIGGERNSSANTFSLSVLAEGQP